MIGKLGAILQGLGKAVGRLGESGGKTIGKAVGRLGARVDDTIFGPISRNFSAKKYMGRDMALGERVIFGGQARAAEGVRPTTLFDQDTAKINRPKREVQPTRRTNGQKTRTKNTAPNTTKTNRPPKTSRTTAPSGTTQKNPPVTKQAPKTKKKGMPVNRTRKTNPVTVIPGTGSAIPMGPPRVPYRSKPIPVTPITSHAPGKSPQALAQNGKKIAQHVRNNKMRYAVGGGAVAVGGGAMMNRTGRGMDKNPGLNKGMYGR